MSGNTVPHYDSGEKLSNGKIKYEPGKSTGGKAHAVTASETLSGASKNRLYTGNPATRQRFTWAVGAGPVTIFMKAVALKSTAGAIVPSVRVTYDAETTIIADANLAQTGSPSTANQNDVIEAQEGSWVREDFSDPLETLDFITHAGAATEFVVRGV